MLHGIHGAGEFMVEGTVLVSAGSMVFMYKQLPGFAR